ncbi:MAG: hypothetical protein AAGI92_03895 [Pseudomonadota bacterium]
MERQAPISPQRSQITYVRAMIAELRVMANAERHDMLTYLLDMAYIEATDIVDVEKKSSTTERRDGNAVA